MFKFSQVLDRGLSIAGALALIVMMVHIVLHALMRTFVNAPIHGTNEAVAYWYLPVIVLLGIPAAQLRNQHITVTLAIDRMGTQSANIYKGFAAGLGGLVSLGFAWYGFQEALSKMAVGATAGVSGVTTWPVYFVVPLAFILLFFLFAVEAASGSKRKQPLVSTTRVITTGKPQENR